MKANPSIPCSSKIPFGIFLSPEVTTAFLCLLNLEQKPHVHLAALARAKQRFPPSPAPFLYKPSDPGEALSVHAGRRAGRARPRPQRGSASLPLPWEGTRAGAEPTNTHLKKYPTSTTKMSTTSTRISREVSSSFCKVFSSVESADGTKNVEYQIGIASSGTKIEL